MATCPCGAECTGTYCQDCLAKAQRDAEEKARNTSKDRHGHSGKK